MAELATIARPYAEALFKAAHGDLPGTAAWLEALAALADHSQLVEFAANPKVSAQQAFELIASLLGGNLPTAAQNFLRVVLDNDRLNALPEIAHQFRVLKNAQSGVCDAVIYSALPLEGAALADLTVTLEKRFKRQLHVRVELDPGLIGGVRVAVGDEVLDTSVKARLEQMKVALTA